jgi:hypothetical protein
MTDPVGDLLQRGVFEVPQLLLSRQGSSTFLSAVHLLTCKPDQGRHHSSELCTQRSKELHENCLYPSLGRADLVRHSDAQDCGAFSWPSSCHRPWKYLSSSSWREQQMVVSRRFQVRVVPFKMSEVQPLMLTSFAKPCTGGDFCHAAQNIWPTGAGSGSFSSGIKAQ